MTSGSLALRSTVRAARQRRLRRATEKVAVRALDLDRRSVDVLVSTPRGCVLGLDVGDGRRFVAKGAYGGRLDAEVGALRWADESGIPIASPVAVLAGPPQVVVTERLAGPSLREIDEDAAWVEAGALLARLHSSPPWPVHVEQNPPSRGRGDWASDLRDGIARAEARDALTPSLAQWAFEVVASAGDVDAATGRRTIVHGDCMPAHLMRDADGRLRLIDLEWLRVDDPAWDLAVLCAFEPERLDAVLSGYAASTEEERRLRRVVPVRQVERMVRALHWHLDHGVPLRRVADMLEVHLRRAAGEPATAAKTATDSEITR